MEEDLKSNFTALLKKVADAYPESDEKQSMVETLTKRFQKEFDNPRLAEASKLLSLKNLDENQYRSLVFFPDVVGGEHYPSFIQSRCKLQPCCLSLMYLVHKECWPFLATFTRFGGLRTLSDLLADENLLVRGQVLDIFLSITAGKEGGFDWWVQPKSAQEHKMHDEMLSLADHQTFLTGLVLNSTADFPGGPVQSLQILAFWLSWVRMLYTPAQRLVLTEELLDAIRVWGGEEVSKEEQELRGRMHEDFSRETPFQSEQKYAVGGYEKVPEWEDEAAVVQEINGKKAEADDFYNCYSGLQNPENEAASKPEQCDSTNGLSKPQEAGVRSPGISSQQSSSATSADWSATQLKEAGNAEFQQSNYKEALEFYNKSLATLKNEEASEKAKLEVSMNVPTVLEAKEDGGFDLSDPKTNAQEEINQQEALNALRSKFQRLTAILHSNKAAAYLKISEAEKDLGDDHTKETIYLGLDEAEKAMDEDSSYLKGHFRYAQLLSQLGKDQQAITHLEMIRKKFGISSSKKSSTITPAERVGLDELLASLLSKIGNSKSSQQPGLQKAGLSRQEKQAQIMGQLLGRQEFYRSGGQLRQVASDDNEVGGVGVQDEKEVSNLPPMSKFSLDDLNENFPKRKSKKKQVTKEDAKDTNKRAPTDPSKASKKKKRSRQAIQAFRQLSQTCEEGDANSIVKQYQALLQLRHNKTGRSIRIPEVLGENLTDNILTSTVEAYSAVLESTTIGQSVKGGYLFDGIKVLCSLTQCSRFNFISMGLEKDCKKKLKEFFLAYKRLPEQIKTENETFFQDVDIPSLQSLFGIS